MPWIIVPSVNAKPVWPCAVTCMASHVKSADIWSAIFKSIHNLSLNQFIAQLETPRKECFGRWLGWKPTGHSGPRMNPKNLPSSSLVTGLCQVSVCYSVQGVFEWIAAHAYSHIRLLHLPYLTLHNNSIIQEGDQYNTLKCYIYGTGTHIRWRLHIESLQILHHTERNRYHH